MQRSRRRTNPLGRQRPKPIPHRARSLRSKTSNQQRHRPDRKGEKPHHDRGKSAVSQVYVQRRETSGPGSEDEAGRSKNHLQPSISRTGYGRNHGARSLRRATAVQLCESYWDKGIAPTGAVLKSENTS